MADDEAQIAALARPVPGTDEEAIYLEDLQRHACRVDARAELHVEQSPTKEVSTDPSAGPDAVDHQVRPGTTERPLSPGADADEEACVQGAHGDGQHSSQDSGPGEPPRPAVDNVSRTETSAHAERDATAGRSPAPSQDAEPLEGPARPRTTATASSGKVHPRTALTGSARPMDGSMPNPFSGLGQAEGASPASRSSSPVQTRELQRPRDSSGAHATPSRRGRRLPRKQKTDGLDLASGGVSSMPHVPSWMVNPALGGFNPLPPRQALHSSVCTKYVMKRDRPQQFTETLVRQAEQMIDNERNFYRRGGIAGWKIKPITSAKATASTRRSGVHQGASRAALGGVGFHFEVQEGQGWSRSHTATPTGSAPRTSHLPDGNRWGASTLEKSSRGAGLSEWSSSHLAHAGNMRRRAAARHGDPLPGRPSSLPPNGLLPPAESWSLSGTGASSGGARAGDEAQALARTAFFNCNQPSAFFERPPRQRRKLPLEGLTPSGQSALAARPPEWLQSLHSTAAVNAVTSTLADRRSTLHGPDLYLQHVRRAHPHSHQPMADKPAEQRWSPATAKG